MDTKPDYDKNGRQVGAEYKYLVPATNAAGMISNGSVVYKGENGKIRDGQTFEDIVPTKTVFDPAVISNEEYLAISKRAAEKAYQLHAKDFANSPTKDNRSTTIVDTESGLKFHVYFDMGENQIPTINNSHLMSN